MPLPPREYIIHTTCPGCKEAVIFRFTDPQDVKNFRLSRQTCPKCRRRYFAWRVDRLPIV